MRVLLVHRYYWPDAAPCGVIMHWIAKHLAAEGHCVDALTSQPSRFGGSRLGVRPRNEKIDGVNVTRVRLPMEIRRPIWRIVNAFNIGFRIIIQAIVKKYDVVIISTVPPVLGGVFAALAAKLSGARFIYYCMDLHPEVGMVSGDFSNPALVSALQWLDDWSCRQAWPVIVHTDDMRKTLLRRARGSEYDISIINNFALPSENECVSPTDLYSADSANGLRLVYAGNLGRFQGLEALLEAMGRIVDRKDIELIVVGDGVAKAGLLAHKKKTNSNVRFLGYQPVELTKAIIQSADIGIVMLIPGMYRLAYPSKTMAYLEQGRPVIAAVEAASDLARTMLAEGYGFCVPIGDSESLARLIVKLADDRSWRMAMSQAALRVFEERFSASVVLAKWSDMLRS